MDDRESTEPLLLGQLGDGALGASQGRRLHRPCARQRQLALRGEDLLQGAQQRLRESQAGKTRERGENVARRSLEGNFIQIFQGITVVLKVGSKLAQKLESEPLADDWFSAIGDTPNADLLRLYSKVDHIVFSKSNWLLLDSSCHVFKFSYFNFCKR